MAPNISLYSPPYESPSEDEFARQFDKYASRAVTVRTQVPFMTRWSHFRVDFCIGHGTSRTVVECDGKEYHNDLDDEWRDALILGGNDDVSTIVRVSAADIRFHPADIFFALLQWVPHVFSERGATNLHRLASDGAKGLDYDGRTTVSIPQVSDAGVHHSRLERRTKDKTDDKRVPWRVKHQFAVASQANSIEELKSAFQQQNAAYLRGVASKR